jgi:hypothetical protein
MPLLCFWKKQVPAKPLGQRTTLSGLSATCGRSSGAIFP